MTKKDLIDYFKVILPRVDKTGKYHSNVIAFTIERAVNNILSDLFLRSPELSDPYMREYVDITTAQNASTGLWEATIPVSYIPVPVVGSGVREMALESGYGLTFVPSRYDDLMRARDFTMQYLSPMISYAVLGSKVVLSHMPDDYVGEQLRMKVFTSFTDYADDDEFTIPYGQDLGFAQNVLQILGLVPPVDLLANNSDYGRGK